MNIKFDQDTRFSLVQFTRLRRGQFCGGIPDTQYPLRATPEAGKLRYFHSRLEQTRPQGPSGLDSRKKFWSNIKIFAIVFFILHVFSIKLIYSDEGETEAEGSQVQQFVYFLEGLGIGELTEEDIDQGLFKENDNSWSVQRQILLKAALNFEDILQEVTILRVLEKEKVVGYYVKEIQEGSLIKNMGFQEGDIIQEINNQPVDDFLQVDNLDKLLLSEKEITIKMKRNGKTIFHRYLIE